MAGKPSERRGYSESKKKPSEKQSLYRIGKTYIGIIRFSTKSTITYMYLLLSLSTYLSGKTAEDEFNTTVHWRIVKSKFSNMFSRPASAIAGQNCVGTGFATHPTLLNASRLRLSMLLQGEAIAGRRKSELSLRSSIQKCLARRTRLTTVFGNGRSVGL